MSAIWGIVDFSKNCISTKFRSTFEEQHKNYAIHRMDSISEAHVLFGCGHQYLTPTAERETLPYLDSMRNILFTCDAVLDNREELLKQFPELTKDSPDGTLLYHAYLKWGTTVCDHLLGAFAFAVYHFDTNQCYLFTDHMSNRSLFYHYRDNVLYFSTLIVPLQAVTSCSPSDKWLASYLSNTSANIAIFESLTPFEGINQCLNATYTVFSDKKHFSRTYWSPLRIKPNFKHTSEEDYKAFFIDTVRTCVESQLHTTGQTGCTLSGGLDSTTVAAFAASALAKRGSKLHSYTSVPLADFKPQHDHYAITDESQKVQDFCRLYPNIQPAFLSCPGKDGFSPLSRLTPLLGYPLKSGHNLTWLNEIYETAHRDGCRLMLKGQFGNSTISYGPALSVFYQLLLSGKWRTMYRSMRSFQKHYHVPLKHIGKLLYKEWFNNRKTPPFDYEDSLASVDTLQLYRIPDAIKRMQHQNGMGNMDSRSQRMHFMFDRSALGQLGMFDTAMGLIHDLLIRDPSKDKRIVELCAHMPVPYYIAGGLERGPIRTFMQGHIPNSILLDIHHRGLQSADNHYRIIKNWATHKIDMIAILESDSLHKYIDSQKAFQLLSEIKEVEEPTAYTTRKLNILYALHSFINTFGGKN